MSLGPDPFELYNLNCSWIVLAQSVYQICNLYMFEHISVYQRVGCKWWNVYGNKIHWLWKQYRWWTYTTDQKERNILPISFYYTSNYNFNYLRAQFALYRGLFRLCYGFYSSQTDEKIHFKCYRKIYYIFFYKDIETALSDISASNTTKWQCLCWDLLCC